MKKLLITGFDPFGGETVNPSWEAVSRLPDVIGPYRLTKLQIPTVFGQAAERVLAAARLDAPDVILCVGQAGGREAVTPERIAINCMDARIPDNAGNQPAGEYVVPDGPAAYFATVPVAHFDIFVSNIHTFKHIINGLNSKFLCALKAKTFVKGFVAFHSGNKNHCHSFFAS